MTWRNAIWRMSVLGALALSASLAWTNGSWAESPAPAPKFRVEGSGQTAEVRYQAPGKGIEVRVINREKIDLPNSIGITLRDEKGNERALELKAIDPLTRAGGLYRGTMPPQDESYVGVMIRIPFKKSKPVLLTTP